MPRAEDDDLAAWLDRWQDRQIEEGDEGPSWHLMRGDAGRWWVAPIQDDDPFEVFDTIREALIAAIRKVAIQ